MKLNLDDNNMLGLLLKNNTVRSNKIGNEFFFFSLIWAHNNNLNYDEEPSKNIKWIVFFFMWARESRVFYCWDNTTFLAITNKPRGIASVKVVIIASKIRRYFTTSCYHHQKQNHPQFNNKIYVIWRNNKCGWWWMI